MRLHAGTFFWPAPAHQFFERADMMDTAVGTTEKDDAAEAAKNGFLAMMKGEGDVVSGWKNKVQTSVANVLPAGALARQHRKMAEPGSAKSWRVVCLATRLQCRNDGNVRAMRRRRNPRNGMTRKSDS